MGKEKFTKEELILQLKTKDVQIKHLSNLCKELQTTYDPLKKEAEHYFAKMDEAYKEQEQMLRDINNECLMSKHNLFVIRNKTGEITGADVAYHLDLIVRKIKHKYGKDTSVGEESL